ncbi:MAG: D-alanine--D-alanine ligase family protein [Candidatus Dormibacterales bacterium]
MRVAVLAGGRSAERQVSLRSGAQVQAALAARGHEVQMVDMDAAAWDRLAGGGFDCVFVALHGRPGEDGTVQGMLELLGLPYTGSGVLASALCIDKTRSNRLLAAAGLAVPEFEEVTVRSPAGEDQVERLARAYGFPQVVKPVREGSTIGLSIPTDVDALADGIVHAAAYDRRVMVQRFVAGVEVTVGVVATPEPRALPILEIVSENPLYDYDAKYTEGRSHHVIPARIPEVSAAASEAAALKAFEVLGCEGMARVDFIVGDEGTPWVLEVNTVPGLTELSLLPDAARAAGIGFGDLCDRLLGQALERSRSEVSP